MNLILPFERVIRSRSSLLMSLTATALMLCSCTVGNTEIPVYKDETRNIEERVEDALSRMTLEEKVAILHARSKFSSPGVQRLGIPGIWCTDGPHGIRAEVFWDQWDQAGWTSDSCVAFPALTCLAATWDTELAALYGKSIGEEALYRGKDVLLGPGVNIYRTPLGGRNFEYMGEDPCLSGRMAVNYVQNVQKNGVAVCVKHFCLNNDETFRHTEDVDLSDRALYEIYLPAFKAAVTEGGAWSIMSSYNLYRGRHVTTNPVLLNDVLKGEWGFDGAVISDWGACHDTDEAIDGGLDLEFGTWTDGMREGLSDSYNQYYLANPYLERLRDGRADTSVLNDKCRRVLRLILRTSMNTSRGCGSLCSDEHYAAARRIGAHGIVLLKNDNGLLPVGNVKRIAVIGENAIRPMTIGGGSSSLKVQREISPLQGIVERAGRDGIEVVYQRGYAVSSVIVQDGLEVGGLEDDRPAAQLLADAVKAASESDMVIFIGGLNKDEYQDCEGKDRTSLDLPYNQNELIDAIAAVNENLVVALVSGNAVSMPWVDRVPSILQAWYGGSESGHSLSDVLFGDVNPSGKLPFTFPKALEDSPAHWQGKPFPVDGKNYYDEGVFVGYRWYETKGIEPLFAFGHGLSYTTFAYGEPWVSAASVREGGKFKVRVSVTNTGQVSGEEVVQLYVSDPVCSVERPVKELKSFAKIVLDPGETKTVEFRMDTESFKFFDEQTHSWKAEKGDFEILVGSASDDIRGSATVRLK